MLKPIVDTIYRVFCQILSFSLKILSFVEDALPLLSQTQILLVAVTDLGKMLGCTNHTIIIGCRRILSVLPSITRAWPSSNKTVSIG